MGEIPIVEIEVTREGLASKYLLNLRTGALGTVITFESFGLSRWQSMYDQFEAVQLPGGPKRAIE